MRLTDDIAGHGHLALPFGAFFGQLTVRQSAPGLDVAVLDADPHRVVERHSHDEAHFVFVLDGLYVSTALGAAPVSDGPALIYNPPGTTHRDRFEARDRSIRGRFLTLSVAAPIIIDAGIATTERAVALQSSHALRLAARLAAACTVPTNHLTIASESLAIELLHVVTKQPNTESGVPRWLSVAREHLDDRLGEPVSMGDVARAAGVHPVHLARVFRRALGCSPGDYLRRRRVEQACVLLRGTSRPLSEIAASCGFSDQSHFTTQFRRAIGITPTGYRRQAGGTGGSRARID